MQGMSLAKWGKTNPSFGPTWWWCDDSIGRVAGVVSERTSSWLPERILIVIITTVVFPKKLSQYTGIYYSNLTTEADLLYRTTFLSVRVIVLTNLTVN